MSYSEFSRIASQEARNLLPDGTTLVHGVKLDASPPDANPRSNDPNQTQAQSVVQQPNQQQAQFVQQQNVVYYEQIGTPLSVDYTQIQSYQNPVPSDNFDAKPVTEAASTGNSPCTENWPGELSFDIRIGDPVKSKDGHVRSTKIQ